MEAEVVKWLVFSLMGVGVWFMKRTVDSLEKRVDENEKDIQRVREEYLHKNDFKEFKLEIRGMFEELKTDIRSLLRKS